MRTYYRTWTGLSFRLLLLVAIIGGAREAAALQTNTVPDLTPRTMEEGWEEVFPCCRLDVSAYPGIGTFGFANRMSRSFAAWWGNDVTWWAKHYPEAIGSLILSDLASSASLLRATQQLEDVSLPQVEDPESANLPEPIWSATSPCCQEEVPLPLGVNSPQLASAPPVSTARARHSTPLRKERIAPQVAEPWTVNSFPEPFYMLLLGSGLLGLGMLRNRSKRL